LMHMTGFIVGFFAGLSPGSLPGPDYSGKWQSERRRKNISQRVQTLRRHGKVISPFRKILWGNGSRRGSTYECSPGLVVVRAANDRTALIMTIPMKPAVPMAVSTALET